MAKHALIYDASDVEEKGWALVTDAENTRRAALIPPEPSITVEDYQLARLSDLGQRYYHGAVVDSGLAEVAEKVRADIKAGNESKLDAVLAAAGVVKK